MNPIVRRNRRLLLLLGVLFLVPVGVAFALYYGMHWHPLRTTNHGELLLPTRALPAQGTPLLGKWSLVYLGDGQCDEACRTALVFARQTRLSLNQDMQRVDRVFIALQNCCDQGYLDAQHPGLKVMREASAGLVAAFPPGRSAYDLFIVDPLGNLVMRYDSRQSPKGLLSDLQKLLKLSHIG